MTEDQERWAEALAIERLHGERAKTCAPSGSWRSGRPATAREWSVLPAVSIVAIQTVGFEQQSRQAGAPPEKSIPKYVVCIIREI